ncbi:MAG TPA: aminopeptidase P family protein [Bacillus bacterium]|uniref:Xaa-Pro dipeptidase n=1 Tax=Siminovitchia fordii TaxID=254759 RepID=A0ABQ4K2I4_9BACI|nr:aminopeptidase P family protein [Siminovitchia fordii]GIN19969.1 Xaa-Pro dipeptidase [Siminovitchia fordii]HBZ08990.1 aminopeptidase P family protein [Bacillus sp. (in: firmicutes)]
MNKIEKIRGCFTEFDIDGLLITSPYNRRYATNFTGTAGVALITSGAAYFITDFRYTEQAETQAKEYEVIQHSGSIIEEIAEKVEKHGIEKLGFEQDYITYSEWMKFEEGLQADLVPVSDVIEGLRIVKTESEIAVIKEAADIADAAFKHILDYIKPGTREIEIANELEFFMRKCGATSSSFDIIVASGWRSALPHGVASEKVIESGDFVTMDYGALHKGYVSDITRTVAVGEPSEQLKEIYQIVLDAQMAAVDKIKPGMTGIEADAIARDLICENGYGEYFGHSLGHGIGLEVHEGPGLSPRSEMKLVPGMTVTVEPGIYLPNVGGVRIEDDILITHSGNDKLTHSAKELIIL